jgi:large subunit ribosomal protein L31
MKQNIHPEYYVLTVTCNKCGYSFVTGSTQPDVRVDICNNCHPVLNGSQGQVIVDTEGRIDRFKKKYQNFSL